MYTAVFWMLKKAFDRLQFDKLFELLCTRNMPCLYLRILLDMYER